MASQEGVSRIFSIRVVSLDYYMAPLIPDFDVCYSDFQGQIVSEVPVIRIYGSTLSGQKTCLHVHGVLPYLYVPCSDALAQSSQEGQPYAHVFALAIEKALKLGSSYGSKRQHVHSCVPVTAKKFYGYHSSDEPFIKVYLYYPHEISRVASLLLGGSILNRCFQPHESHIPYLLQFMVDNNLYGMGHIHLSKVKFRSPMPQELCSRASGYFNRSGCNTTQVEGGDFVSSPMPWLSSTVSFDWVWFSPEAGTSDKENISPARQSVCELECDTTVDEILNKNCLLYMAFSQANSDVRMVQSLIPIWEEEQARSGILELVSCDTTRPPPEDVMQSLSLGLDYDSLLIKLLDDSTSGSCNINHSELNKTSQPSLGSADIPNAAPKVMMGHNLELKSSADEFLKSTNEVGDIEALGLLKWLASSQAKEDIDSDDELAHECVLNPLLPAATVGEVLEKAYSEYEIESQQECQDILDSVEDALNFKGFEEQIYLDNPHHLAPPSPVNLIPQMDGSCDEPEMGSKAYERNSQEEMPSVDFSCSIDGCKSNQQLQCSLPFSVVGFHPRCPVYDVPAECHIPESNGCSTACPMNKGGHEHGVSAAGGFDEISILREVNEASSLRDLMRRKRNHHQLMSENTCHESAKKHDPGKRIHKSTSSHLEENDNNVVAQNAYSSLKLAHLSSSVKSGMELKDCKLKHFNSKLHRYGVLPLDGLDKNKPPLDLATKHDCIDGINKGQNNLDDIKTRKSSPIGQSILYGESSVSPRTVFSREWKPVDCCKYGPIDSDLDLGSATIHAFSSKVPTELTESLEPHTSYAVQELSSDECFLDGSSKSSCLKIVCESRNIMEGTPVLSHCPVPVKDLQDAAMDAKLSVVSPSHDQCSQSSRMDPIMMAFAKKPPTLEQLRQNTDSELFTCKGNPADIGSHDSLTDLNMLPFLMENKNEVEKCCSDDMGIPQLADVIHGVPTHCLNDGSLLFMLTPALSPPSPASVNNWLQKPVHCDVEIVEKGKLLRINPEFGKTSSESENMCTALVPQTTILTSDITVSKYAPNRCADDSQRSSHDNADDVSQISGPLGKSKLTPLSQIGFRDPARYGAGQQLTLLSIEILAESRGELQPDPRYDPINVIALAVQEDFNDTIQIIVLLRETGHGTHGRNVDGLSCCKLVSCSKEKDLLEHFVELVGSLDPDILLGWDIQGNSLGFLAERAAYLQISLLKSVSRTLGSATKFASGNMKEDRDCRLKNMIQGDMVTDALIAENAIIEDEWGRTHMSGIHVGGRIVLNLWRILRSELRLTMYTLEAVSEAVLRQKIPYISCKILTRWFSSGPGMAQLRCIQYVVGRARLNLEIMDQLDMFNRTSELARVFGIDFFSVLSRGSQYRVESMLLRLAHTQNYLAISPSSQQVASQPAMECLPLVMEPESGFYADPVVVLDFQALYPSMIIAYNLCFSTCLGKLVPAKPNTLGICSYTPGLKVLQEFRDQLLLTPNGVMYVPSKVRKGVLPCLLEEILTTRIMVKKSMKKLTESEKILYRIFDARQLALKLIANVTYGYTAAGFSGRMPCAELADSIVQCGRRTLEKAISFISAHETWNARVIYGDTDSMFVLLKGRTLEEAFIIGQEMATTVTAMNPYPVTLKMEKVYNPCFLLTKKRYVGYSYENPGQTKPTFDAKGIETVRRDTCPAVAKMLEQSLRTFFESQDISKVKAYLQRQWTRILCGKVSLQDFVLSKEVRLGTYSSRTSSLPPAAIVAMKAMRADPRAEPRYGDRIPYIVVHGEPGARLIDLVVDPLDVLDISSPYTLNDLYYIKKQIIPPLQRVFGLLGVDLNRWFSEMPRPVRPTLAKRFAVCGNVPKGRIYSKVGRTRIDNYYTSRHCTICGEIIQGRTLVCDSCSKKGPVVATCMTGTTARLEHDIQHLTAICRHCGGGDWITESGVKCTSLACPVFYERRKIQKELQAVCTVASEAGFYPKCMVEWF
ncbi:DNA polymerase zeta catalytic subunit isoform X3 [Nymphaea colorata]|uniref:DNA polymerase zeta catalytic subunit isoform X3 n=1 Tax=Nymphaea colorata TaxID=210225 RepID=UPI00129DC24C|nr:DNA polymerase zeta catalytic subunit isoform X3 [Nymphaea colorata]